MATTRWERGVVTPDGRVRQPPQLQKVTKNIAISVVIARFCTLCKVAGQKREHPVDICCVA